MSHKAVYHLSARQILLIAFASALMAVGVTACLSNFSGVFSSRGNNNIALAEDAPSGISEPSTVSNEQNNIEIYRTLAPGVAFITSTSYRLDSWGDAEEGRGTGSGSVIDPKGYILTNNHVVEGAQKLTVSLGGGKTYPAEVVGTDLDTDLAVIKIQPPPEGLTIVPMGDSDKLSVGQKVVAIGNPFGLDRTMTTGIISGLQRPIRARNNRTIEGAIQTDASINPGNSGGPLLDKYGRMIGINSQILSPAGGSVGVGFAIPVSIAKRVIPQLIQFGEVRRPKLGAMTPSIATLEQQYNYDFPVGEGLLIYQTAPGGSAERAGLRGMSQGKIGDIITAVDGEKMSDTDDLFRVLDKHQIGDTISVEVFRDGKSQAIPVKLIPLPQNRAAGR